METSVQVPPAAAVPDALLRRALDAIESGRLAELLVSMTAIPSPSGEERPLAEHVVAHLRAAGIEAEVDELGGRAANAVGRLRGSGGGGRLLLYAPLDTAFAGATSEDEPWLGASPRADFALPPRRERDQVVGLGAENPKAFAACAIVALEAMAAAGAVLPGDLELLLAGRSMPILARPATADGGNPAIGKGPLGFGAGSRAHLERHDAPDAAIVLKPGYAVSHEEVGLAWFRLTVRGAVNYTGIRHKGPYRNPILAAAGLVTGLEAWIGRWSTAAASGTVAPQGSINAIRAGAGTHAAFTPATCVVDVDLRVSPRSSPDQVQAELEAAVNELRAAEPELDVTVERTAALPGTATDPDAWIVRCLVRAWEWREERTHVPAGRTSGASDAAVLRGAGIPTARIGLPPPATPSPYPGFSMGVAATGGMTRLTEVLVRAMVDAASRTRSELGGGPMSTQVRHPPGGQ